MIGSGCGDSDTMWYDGGGWSGDVADGDNGDDVVVVMITSSSFFSSFLSAYNLIAILRHNLETWLDTISAGVSQCDKITSKS